MKGDFAEERVYEFDIHDMVIERMLDPEWQSHMYHFDTGDEAIRWLVVQLVDDNRKLSQIDGFADMPDHLVFQARRMA